MSEYYELAELEEGETLKYPVTLDEALKFCRITDPDINPQIEVLIIAATNRLEKYCQRCFMQREFIGYFSELEYSNFEIFPFLKLRRAPFAELISASYICDSETVEMNEGVEFKIKKNSGYSKLIFAEALITDLVPYPFVIEFKAGYGAAVDVPVDIKIAICMYIAFLYENRGDVQPDGAVKIPNEIKALLAPRRILERIV